MGDLQGFFEIREAELLSGFSDFVDEGVGEINVAVRTELVLPVLGIKFALDLVWIVEEAAKSSMNVSDGNKQSNVLGSLQFPVKATGPCTQRWINPVQMVRSSDDKYTVITLQAVQLVQEE